MNFVQQYRSVSPQMKTLQTLALALVIGAVVGCGGSPQVNDAPASTTLKDVDLKPVLTIPEAGMPVAQSSDPTATKFAVRQASLRSGGVRPDPFALRSDEQQFDLQQNSERVLGTMGGWLSEFQPTSPFPDAPSPVPEPQPYRRLAGVVVGDSVLALIDMGNGQTYLVRPGMDIPDSEWKVVSIDMDKAILRREGNRLPHEITVRLELPPPGMGGTPGGGFPGGGFNPGGGTGGPAGFGGANGGGGNPGPGGGAGAAG